VEYVEGYLTTTEPISPCIQWVSAGVHGHDPLFDAFEQLDGILARKNRVVRVIFDAEVRGINKGVFAFGFFRFFVPELGRSL